MCINVWIDDTRKPPIDPEKSYVWVKSYDEAIGIVDSGPIDSISLDYDLGYDKTGYDIACYIEKKISLNKMKRPILLCHSMNLFGKQKINAVINRLNNLS